MLKLNKFLFFTIEFLLFIALFYVLFNASVNMLVFPFAFGMLFALAWANQKVFLLAPAYIIAGVLKSATLNFAICNLVCVFCLIVPYFIHVICKKNMRKWEFYIFALLGQTANVIFDITSHAYFLIPLANIVLGLAFLFVCITVFEAIVIRGFTNKLTILEIVSLFTIIGAVCGGLCNLNISGFSFLKLFMCFVLLLFAYCSTPLLTLLVSAVGGVGALVATNNPLYIAPFILWALVALLFKKRYKIFMCVGVILVEAAIGFYFKLYLSFGIIEFLPVILACVVFLLLPKKTTKEIEIIFNLSKDRLAMKNIVNRNREILHRRLGNLAEVFNEMNLIYRNLLKNSMSFEDVKVMINQEIIEKICSFCPERNRCHRTFEEKTKSVFDELIKISFEKGKVTLLEIPSYLTARCRQTNAILGCINALCGQYKKYMTMMSDVDTSKLIIAEQLLGVSQIMTSLSKQVETNVSFDTAKENKILDELTYHNIICIDAVVYEKDIHTLECSIVVRNEDASKPKIADAVSKVCGCKMSVYENFSSVRPGYTVLNLKTAPKYDCLLGVSQHTKNGCKISGDSYSIIKLDGSRILFAISDGMGSGEKACDTSELSLTLVENFYKAGFDNDLILSTVNKLLSLHKQEIFSAMDICVLDEKNGIADFIKFASPKSFILSENECKLVETGALPLGIVKECKPLTKKACISQRDMIILVSDGISDSFDNDEQLLECIKSLKTKNPQEFADQLLCHALASNNGYAVDDMTVVVAKII